MGMGTQPMGQTQAGPNSQSQMMMGGMMPPSTSSNGQGQMSGPPYNSANGQSQISSNGQSSMPGMMPPSQTQMPPMMPSVGKPTVRRQVSLLPAGEARTTYATCYANSGFSNQPSGSITPSYSNAPNSPMMNGQAASNPSPSAPLMMSGQSPSMPSTMSPPMMAGQSPSMPSTSSPTMMPGQSYPPSGSPTAAYQTAPNSGTATNVLALPSSNAYGSMKGSSAPYPMTSADPAHIHPRCTQVTPPQLSMGQTAEPKSFWINPTHFQLRYTRRLNPIPPTLTAIEPTSHCYFEWTGSFFFP
ncbi:hypothetical protein PSHT_03266 [Puccinia striiformis]|uniref:Uncharacterized protein n=1 Tax=Puccinia striiformis TaxID=27350 RepID=A0A2S4WG15_9BASI|nr:hypothetical protein PSHT_03266 [Puccinia striiformis]